MSIFKASNQSIKWLFAELTVVVLGILIAFQVDEWRTKIGEEREIINALDAVLLDLEDEKESLEAYIVSVSNQYRGSSVLLSHVRDTKIFDQEIIEENYILTRRTRLWSPHSSSYLNMRESGTYSLINDQEFQLALYDYYDWMRYIQVQIDRHNVRATRLVEAALEDFYISTDESTGDIRVSIVQPVENIPRNPSLVGALGEFSYSTQNLKSRFEETLERNEIIQASINSYLEKM